MSNKTLVAVYGTLRQGNGNHRLISQYDSSEFLGEGIIPKRATMFSNGGFPYLSFDAGDKPQMYPTVEVYAVDDDCLADLDCLEGYPGWYDRSKVDVILFTNENNLANRTVTAFVYHQDKDFDLPVIESGDWMEGRRRA